MTVRMLMSAAAPDEKRLMTSYGEDRSLSEVQRFVLRPQFTIRHTVTADCEFESHSHSAFTITAVLSGRMSVTIGERLFELSSGGIALTNAGQSHSANASDVEFVSI